MKASILLPTLAIVVVIIGSGLSYFGYNESLQSVTVTSTKSVTHTSTRIVASTTTESTVYLTSSTAWIVQEEVIDIEGIGAFGGQQKTCWVYDSVQSTLDVGPMHVSYSSEGGNVDFWMLSKGQWDQWDDVAATCGSVHSVEATVMRSSSKAYEFSKDIKSAGDYYFVFLNRNIGSVSVTLNVDAGVKHTEMTETSEHTSYSTIESPFVTETVKLESHPAGLGVIFYFGIPVAVAGIGLVIFPLSRRRGPLGSQTIRPGAPVAPSVAQPTPSVARAPPPAGFAGKFCINCGVPLPAHATFCSKCGARQ